MLLLIMCCDLEVADRRMTTAIKLVLAQAFVSGSTSLVRQLMGNRVLHRCPFAQRGPATLGLYLGFAASAGTARPHGCSGFCLARAWLSYTERARHMRHTPQPETGQPCRGPGGLFGHLDRSPA